MEIAFATLAEMKSEVEARQKLGHEILDANHTRTRRLGYLDCTTEDFLFVPMSNLTADQILAHLDHEKADPALEAAFADSVEEDVMDHAMLLAAGEREAAKNWQNFPTKEQMQEWAGAIEKGLVLDNAPRHTDGGSPFRFSWSRGDTSKHHTLFRVVTDHLGVTVEVLDHHGVEVTLGRFADRLTWAEVSDLAVLTDWVAKIGTEALRVYEAVPECQCRYHKFRRAGRIK